MNKTPIKKKRISVQSAKDKGRRLQKWTCEKISELTGLDWGKDQPIESRGMGQSGVDVRLEKSALDLFPFSVECKYQESWGVHNWIKQAEINKIENTDWLLICKRNQNLPVVIMDAERFFDLLKQTKLFCNLEMRKYLCKYVSIELASPKGTKIYGTVLGAYQTLLILDLNNSKQEIIIEYSNILKINFAKKQYNEQQNNN